jgi:uncharacterized protein
VFQRSLRARIDTLALFAAVLPFGAAWIYFVLMAGDDRARFVYLGAKIVQFSLPLIWLWTVGGSLWVRPELSRSQVLWGVLSGLVMAGGLVGWYGLVVAGSPIEPAAQDRITATLANFRIQTPLAYIGMAIGLSLLHSFLEEYYWRGFVFGRLSAWVSPLPAVFFSSLAFAAHHLLVIDRYVPPGQFWSLTIPATLAVAAGGAAWCWLYRRTGSLAAPWISHVVVDAALMLLGYWLTFGQL